MSETTELKPCPFCGSSKVGCDGGNIPPNFAYCVDCGAFGPNAEDGSPEAAIAAWNKRAAPALAARVEALTAQRDELLDAVDAALDDLNSGRQYDAQYFLASAYERIRKEVDALTPGGEK